MTFSILFFILANAWWMISALCFAIRPTSYVGIYYMVGCMCLGAAIGGLFN